MSKHKSKDESKEADYREELIYLLEEILKNFQFKSSLKTDEMRCWQEFIAQSPKSKIYISNATVMDIKRLGDIVRKHHKIEHKEFFFARFNYENFIPYFVNAFIQHIFDFNDKVEILKNPDSFLNNILSFSLF